MVDEKVEEKVEVEEKEVEETTEETTEVEADTEEEDKEDEDEEEEGLDEAKQLVSIMKDRDKFKAFILQSAEQLGVLPKSEKREAIKSITDIVREALGEYGSLADKLGPALEKIINDRDNSIKSEIQADKQAKLTDEFKTAWGTLSASLPEFKKVEMSIATLAKEFPYSGTGNLKQYIKRLYNLAQSERNSSVKSRTEVTEETKVYTKGVKKTPSGVDESTVRKGSSLPSRAEAIKAAIEGRNL